MILRAFLLLVAVQTSFCMAELAPVKIALVGDSTVNDPGGWGGGLKEWLGPGVELTNAAANGRSSKSYRDEGRWQQALELKADYYLIQFGHNDQPGKGPERETDPETTYRENLRRYVTEARAIGAKPILVTSLTRRNFDPGTGRIADTLEPYAVATRAVAEELGVPLIDLHARSIEFCNAIGEAASHAFNPPTTDGKPDNTHLNPAGSEAFARLVAEEIGRVAPKLATRLKRPGA
jgi:lysophospholipase L1-like esterase